MDRNDIQRYIDLRKQLAELEAQMEELKPQVAEHIHQLGDKLKFGDYLLRSQISRSYTYSSAVDALQKQLTEKRREEVAQGVAQVKKETRFVMMSSLDQPNAPSRDDDREPPDDEDSF